MLKSVARRIPFFTEPLFGESEPLSIGGRIVGISSFHRVFLSIPYGEHKPLGIDRHMSCVLDIYMILRLGNIFRHFSMATEISERFAKLSYILGEGATEITKEIQHETLQELYQIRDLLAENPSLLEEMSSSAVKQEIDTLKEENNRLKYRIEHLKRHVE